MSKIIGTLYFSAARAELWYNKKEQTLYVVTSMIYEYHYVSPLMWLQIKNGNKAQLETIYATQNPIIATKIPRGCEYFLPETNGIQMYDVDSSNVEAIGYDDVKKQLYIKFLSKGHPVYRYENVPQQYWEALLKADSKGSWTHWFLKINDGEFPYTKVSGYDLIYSGLKPANPGTPHPDGYMTVV